MLEICTKMALDTQSGSVPSGLFGAFRSNGAPTYYSEVRTSWHADILEAGFIFAGCILAVSFFSMLPGIHGKSVSKKVKIWRVLVASQTIIGILRATWLKGGCKPRSLENVFGSCVHAITQNFVMQTSCKCKKFDE